MSMLDAARYRLHVLRRALFDRARWRREMDAELDFHLALEEQQRRHEGADADDARRAALRRLGDPRRVRERLVDDSGASALDALRQDLRFAVRALRARPGFTAVAVLTLAIGLGANVAIFSAVDALLLRRLPFAAPHELMQVSLTRPPEGDQPARDDAIWSYPKARVFRAAQTAFADLTIYTSWPFTVRVGAGAAERVRGEYVDGRYLPTLGVAPLLGRNFAPDEDRTPNGPRVALLSEAFWRSRFGGDPGALGRAVTVAGEPYTVVGVLPPGFRGLSGEADLLLPVMTQSAEALGEAWNHSYTMVARRRPGVSETQALAAVRVLGARVDDAYPEQSEPRRRHGAAARALDATRVDPALRRALLVLSGAVGLVLLVACANVANLLLVRAAGRRREIAVRLALGAGRGRLVRQLLTESVLLAALGAAAGVLVAAWGVRALAAIDPARTLPMARTSDLRTVSFAAIQLDATALAFGAALALATAVVFGLAPALQATRPSPAGALKDGAPGSGAARPRRGAPTRAVLAAVEVALAMVLLAGAGLTLRSLERLLAVAPGVRTAGVLTVRFDPRAVAERDSFPALFARVTARVAAIPGVAGVALQDCPPLNGGCNGTALVRRDRPQPRDGEGGPEVGVHWITPEWPAVMGVPLLRGRAFTDADRRGARKAVLVSAHAARVFWPGEDAVGKPVSVMQGGFHDDTATVVGVVGDVRYGTLDDPPRPDVYLPYAQSPYGRAVLVVRTPGAPLALVGAVRAALAEVAPGTPAFEVRTMEDRVEGVTAFQRFGATLLGLFAAVALVLATLGVYGVVSFGAAQRTRELGVRVALGATRRDLARLVVRGGLAIALAGTLAGLAGALAATRVLRSLLYGVAPTDPATYAAIVLVLGAAVVAASWLPARRAARVAPATVLRDA
jgi:predicted permease